MMSSYWDRNISLIVSDVLSIITVYSCLFIKVPQIKTICSNKSSKGISAFGLCLELFSYTIMMSYNYSAGYNLLSYMEYPLLLFQEYILIYWVLFYQNMLGKKAKIMAAIYAFVVTLIYFHMVPVLILTFLVPFCTPIGAVSKVLQLYEILKVKDAGSVSRKTWAISALTNITRIYTVYVQSRDWVLLSNFIISTILSSSVFGAACIYKRKEVLKKE